MPREDAPSTTGDDTDPDVLDRGLSGLLDLVGRTPGWEVDPYGEGHRILGGTKPIIVPSYTTSAQLVALKAVLTGDGWSQQAAEENIARLTALYDQARTQIPEGGYPKVNRVITRQEARYILAYADECGCNARPVRPGRVKTYSEAMDRGEWRWLHPQPLLFSAEHDCLLDGGHRLRALLKSSLGEMGFVAITEVPIEVFKYLDQGANRSIADILAGTNLSKEARRKVGPMVKLAMQFDSGLPWKKWPGLSFTGPQVTNALAGPYNEMPGKPYKDALTLGWNARDYTGCKMLPATAGMLSFVVRRDYPEGPWEEFRTALVYGDNLPRGDARGALRNLLLGRDVKKQHRYEPYLQMGAALMAWAYWLNDIPGTTGTFIETQAMPRVWKPNMPLPGSDPNRMVRDRKARLEAQLAKEQAESGSGD